MTNNRRIESVNNYECTDSKQQIKCKNANEVNGRDSCELGNLCEYMPEPSNRWHYLIRCPKEWYTRNVRFCPKYIASKDD